MVAGDGQAGRADVVPPRSSSPSSCRPAHDAVRDHRLRHLLQRLPRLRDGVREALGRPSVKNFPGDAAAPPAAECDRRKSPAWQSPSTDQCHPEISCTPARCCRPSGAKGMTSCVRPSRARRVTGSHPAPANRSPQELDRMRIEQGTGGRPGHREALRRGDDPARRMVVVQLSVIRGDGGAIAILVAVFASSCSPSRRWSSTSASPAVTRIEARTRPMRQPWPAARLTTSRGLSRIRSGRRGKRLSRRTSARRAGPGSGAGGPRPDCTPRGVEAGSGTSASCSTTDQADLKVQVVVPARQYDDCVRRGLRLHRARRDGTRPGPGRRPPVSDCALCVSSSARCLDDPGPSTATVRDGGRRSACAHRRSDHRGRSRWSRPGSLRSRSTQPRNGPLLACPRVPIVPTDPLAGRCRHLSDDRLQGAAAAHERRDLWNGLRHVSALGQLSREHHRQRHVLSDAGPCTVTGNLRVQVPGRRHADRRRSHPLLHLPSG